MGPNSSTLQPAAKPNAEGAADSFASRCGSQRSRIARVGTAGYAAAIEKHKY